MQKDHSPTPPAIRVTGASFRWPGPKGAKLDIDHLDVTRGENVLLLGPSGAGKSTLLGLICGIYLAQQGSVEVLGQDMAALGASARDRFRAEHCGIIFQMFNLLPYANAVDNVCLPLAFAPERRARVLSKGAVGEESLKLLEALAVPRALARETICANLSVGQQQRVAAARALIGAPDLIVADEPTSALDGAAEARFLDLLFAQVKACDATVLMVSHDERLAPRFDRVVRLLDVARLSVEVAA